LENRSHAEVGVVETFAAQVLAQVREGGHTKRNRLVKHIF
jgi:hypothetical protein